MHGKAKELAEIDGEKEIVETSTVQAMGKNKYGNITQSDLEEKLNSNAGDDQTEVINNGDTLVVKFVDSGRYYEVDSEGNVERIEVIVDNNPGNIKIGINGEELKGTEESPFEIWCIEDLVEWSQNYIQYQDSYIKLGRTLNFNSNLSYTDGKVLDCTSIDELKMLLTNTSGSGFTPIADFSGNFDGQNFEIQNIYENVTGKAGLFAKVGGTVQNLAISGCIISNDGYAGGIGGESKSNLFVSKCINNCKITANNSISNSNGALCGSAGGIIGNCGIGLVINNCINNGDINGVESTGGIVGYLYYNGITILNCSNNATISGTNAGGIFGSTVKGSVKIYNCYNVGDISGSTAGGIMGYKYHNTATEIKNCYNFSNISGESFQGEIIGRNWAFDSSSSATIENVFYTNENIGAFGGSTNSNGTPIYYGSSFDDNFVTNLNDYIKTISDQEINWNNWILGSKGYPIFE